MKKKLAVLLAGLSVAAVIASAPAQAGAARPAYDTNWPCHGC